MRNIVLTMIIIFALALTGCGRVNNSAKENKTNSPQQSITHNEQNNNPSTATGSSATNQTSGSTAIVAKSGNIVSSSDKEALLNYVEKELDALLNDVNNLEDVQDTDLDLNQ